jgi:hypothetical protein
MGDPKDMKNLLREKFEHFEPEPTRDIWAGIERAVRPKPFYKRMGWYGYASAAIVLLLVAIGISMTEVLYRQPSAPDRRLATVSPDTAGHQQLPVTIGPQNASVQEPIPPLAQPGKQETTGKMQTVAQQRQTEPKENNPDTEGTQEREAIVPGVEKKNINPLLALNRPESGIPSIGAEANQEGLQHIAEVPVVAAANRQTTGNRNQVDLADFSLEDALAIAGDGLKKLAKKPEEVSESQDGTENIKTYRIKFLDISFSKRTHTFKSTKEET